VELNNCFAERSTQLLRCIVCLDPQNSFANFDEDKLIELAQIYVVDFTQWRMQVLHVGDLAIKMMQTDRHTTFPLVYRLVELALILPVTTATIERAFSAMKIVKTDLRNKMGSDWLNHRMVCYIEREIFSSIPNDQILYQFQEMKSRMKMLPKQPRTTSVNGMFSLLNN
jgi:hypothetical protein